MATQKCSSFCMEELSLDKFPRDGRSTCLKCKATKQRLLAYRDNVDSIPFDVFNLMPPNIKEDIARIGIPAFLKLFPRKKSQRYDMVLEELRKNPSLTNPLPKPPSLPVDSISYIHYRQLKDKSDLHDDKLERLIEKVGRLEAKQDFQNQLIMSMMDLMKSNILTLSEIKNFNSQTNSVGLKKDSVFVDAAVQTE